MRSSTERHSPWQFERGRRDRPQTVPFRGNRAEVGSRLVAGARISSFGVIVLIPAPQAAPEVPSQPSALIGVEGPRPAAGGATGRSLLPPESALVDGKPQSSRRGRAPRADPSADSVEDSMGTCRREGGTLSRGWWSGARPVPICRALLESQMARCVQIRMAC